MWMCNRLYSEQRHDSYESEAARDKRIVFNGSHSIEAPWSLIIFHNPTEMSRKYIFAVFHPQNNPKTLKNKSTTHSRDACLPLTASLSFLLKIKDGAAVNKVYVR